MLSDEKEYTDCLYDDVRRGIRATKKGLAVTAVFAAVAGGIWGIHIGLDKCMEIRAKKTLEQRALEAEKAPAPSSLD